MKVLEDRQRWAVDEMKRPGHQGATLLGAELGTGKTLISTAFLKETNARTALIVVPKQTEDSWVEELENYDMPHPVRVLKTTTKRGKRAIENAEWGAHGYYIVSHQLLTSLMYDYVPKMSGGKPVKDENGKVKTRAVRNSRFANTTFDVIVFDEVHRGSNPDSQTHEALMSLKSRYRVGASGTFAGNSFRGAYAVTRWLWPHLINMKYRTWRDRWCSTRKDPYSKDHDGISVTGEKVEGAFVASLPRYVYLPSTVPAPVIKNVEIDLYPEQMRVYRELDTRMLAWVQENPLVVRVPVVKSIRQRQATLAMPSLTFEGNELVDVTYDLDAESAKADEILRIIREELDNEQVLIYTDYQTFAPLMVHRLEQEFGEGCAIEWSGAISHAKRRQNKQKFMDGKVRFIVGVIAAMGTGTDGLQHTCSAIINASISTSRVDNEQAIGRLVRRGQTKIVRVWNIIARNTLDKGQQSKQVRDALSYNKSLLKDKK